MSSGSTTTARVSKICFALLEQVADILGRVRIAPGCFVRVEHTPNNRLLLDLRLLITFPGFDFGFENRWSALARFKRGGLGGLHFFKSKELMSRDLGVAGGIPKNVIPGYGLNRLRSGVLHLHRIHIHKGDAGWCRRHHPLSRGARATPTTAVCTTARRA